MSAIFLIIPAMIFFALLFGEYYTTASPSWREDKSDRLLDGAVRVATSVMMDDRIVTLRCFQFSAVGGLPQYDLRYMIQMPLLKRLIPEMKKSGDVKMVVSIDGIAVATLPAQPVAHDFGISFLANIAPGLITKFEGAKRQVIVMLRQGTEQLDSVMEFGVKNLQKHLAPVKQAYAAIEKLATPAPTELSQTRSG